MVLCYAMNGERLININYAMLSGCLLFWVITEQLSSFLIIFDITHNISNILAYFPGISQMWNPELP
jgi:hypothetical protein